jgi:hypothetical protein
MVSLLTLPAVEEKGLVHKDGIPFTWEIPPGR